MRMIEAVGLVLSEHRRSVEKHGNWLDYSVAQMMSVIINELVIEAGNAECAGDIHGPHGVVNELAQVAACCIKAIMVLSDSTDETLAETLRTAGAHSGVEGSALPASPTPPQREDIPINSPEGERV